MSDMQKRIDEHNERELKRDNNLFVKLKIAKKALEFYAYECIIGVENGERARKALDEIE